MYLIICIKNEINKFAVIQKFINKAISIKHAIELLSCSEKNIKKDGTIRYNNKLYQIDKGQTLYNNRIVIDYKILENNWLIISGKNPNRNLAEFIEIKDHPFFIATQAHPEFKSRLENPHPLFVGLVKASLKTLK